MASKEYECAQEACNIYGHMTPCNWQGDCNKCVCFLCKLDGQLCTALCYGGRRGNKNAPCMMTSIAIVVEKKTKNSSNEVAQQSDI